MSSTPAPDDGYPSELTNGQADGVPMPADDEITLRELLDMLWGGKWVILTTFVVVLALGVAYVVFQPPTYETSTLVLVEDNQSGPSSLLSDSRSSLFGGRRNLTNEILIADRSRAIAERVARRLDSLEQNPYTGEPLSILTGPEGERRSVSGIVGDLKASGGTATVSAAAAGSELAGRYESPDALRITARGAPASEVALIANAYAEAYMEYNLRKMQEGVRSARQFLETQVAKFRNRVAEAEQRLQAFMEEEKAVALNQKTSRIVEQIASLEARRDEIRIELDMKASALQTTREELSRIRPNLPEKISSSAQEELAEVQSQLAKVSVEISSIQRRRPGLTPEDPQTARGRELARLQERRRKLEREADSLSRRYVEQTLAAGGIGSAPAGDRGGASGGRGLSYVVKLQREVTQKEIKVQGLRAQLRTVTSRLAEYRDNLDALPEQSLQLAQLKRERRSREKIFQFAQEQLQEVRMAEQSEVGNTEVLQPAVVPGSPVAPQPRLVVVLAAFLGLLGGISLVFLREVLDTKLRAPEELEAMGPQVLASIPDMTPLIRDKFGGEETLALEGRTVPTTLVMLTAPMSAAAEGYQRLRANLQFSRPDEPVQTIMVTSPGEAEGKTTTTTNLALSLASAGRRTLLIDADLRRAQLHNLFDREQSPGLTEVLYDESVLRQEGVVDVDIDGLSVLPAGGDIPNPAELLGSDRMSRFVDRMEEDYDRILIDTPPLLLFSDPVFVVSHTDGALLVAQANRTETSAYEKGLALLSDVGETPLGAVLNQFDPEKAASYGYDSGYGYSGYGYGYQYDDRSLEAYTESGGKG